MIKLIVRSTILVVCALVGSKVAFASATSAGGWVANTPSDAPYITRNIVEVLNTDTVSARYVTASSGVWLLNPSTTYWSFHGINNGSNLTCTVYLTEIFTGAFAASGSVNTTAVGLFHIQATVPAPPAGYWTYNLQCGLPPYNGTHGYARLRGSRGP